MPFAGRGLGLSSSRRTGTAEPVGVGGQSARYAAATFLLAAAYICVAMAAVQLVTRFFPALDAPISTALASVVLLAGGLLVVAARRVPQLRSASAIGLVRRPSAARELGLGAAVGWAAAVLLVLPGLLLLHMQCVFNVDGMRVFATLGSTLLLFLFVVGRQLVFCGLPFRSLALATSPLFASIAFSGVAGLLVLTSGGDTGQALIAAMVQLVLSAAAARTRAIWLGIGLQFAWAWSITVLFGLPSFLAPPISGIVSGEMTGPRWLTGANFGPEAALWAAPVALAALIAVWRVTRDYAWHYTYEPIEGAGYPMDVPPPAEHVRMEAAAQTPVLVQIGSIGSGGALRQSPERPDQT